MIVYGAHAGRVAVADRLAELRDAACRFTRSGAVDRELAAELLIDAGELEAGVVDALTPHHDTVCAAERACRAVSLSCGRIVHALRRGAGGAHGEAAALIHSLDRLAALPLPERVDVSVPEGYAYYAVYPEAYADAAERFAREHRPVLAVCVGIRSIGTSLSAGVAAALEAHGCDVRSYTVRPRGHPFDRRVSLGHALDAELRALAGGDAPAHFLVVDEGPGLSGSSIASVAGALAATGVPDDRITLFPSWEPDPAGFRSEAARDRWGRHRKYSTSFERLWLDDGRLARAAGCDALTDLSGGAWRRVVFERAEDAPAVQPQHERRKYLCGGVGQGRAGAWLLKFAGLGHYGRAAHSRAAQLADAGFAPPACGVVEGFLASRFVPGRPLAPAPDEGELPELLRVIADYLAHVARTYPGERPLPYDELVEMVRVNTEEALGPEWGARVRRLDRLRDAVCHGATTAIDGRMLPHEWIRTPGGRYLKTDAVDHHRDHFFPGHQDVAWDLAGSCVEFALSPGARDALVGAYARRARDAGVAARLPFYTVAYLAFRLGYCTLAAESIGGSRDGVGQRVLAARYARQLQEVLCSLPA